MFSKINNCELDMIDYFRKIGAGELKSEPRDMCSTEYFLRNWAREKQWLYKIFGEQLILSRSVSYAIPQSKIRIEIEKAYYGEEGEDDVIYKFIRHYQSKLEFYFYGRTRSWGDVQKQPYINYVISDWGGTDLCENDYVIFSALYNLFTVESLTTTTYQGTTKLQIKMPKTGKTITLVPNQTKVMRIGQSLIKELELDKELFEKFRIKHSKFFNQAKLEGELCISIHPLDYITMSENASNWKSCMNWQENGCYRRGTIEMMNSPYVVVAYLKNTKKPFNFGDNYSWNNKMWRMLFIVTEQDCIAGIKGYPYAHDEMTQDIIKWLAELVNNASATPQYNTKAELYEFEGAEWYINFETNAMYNDFGCTQDGNHWIAYGFERTTDNINYSGMSECVWCGDDEYAIQEESDLFVCSQEDLACKHCSAYIGVCPDCGARIRDGEIMTYNGEYDTYYYCLSCGQDHIRTCPVTGEVGLINELEYCDFCWLGLKTQENYIASWVLVKNNCWNTHPKEWVAIFGDQYPVEYITTYGSRPRRKFQISYESMPIDSQKKFNT